MVRDRKKEAFFNSTVKILKILGLFLLFPILAYSLLKTQYVEKLSKMQMKTKHLLSYIIKTMMWNSILYNREKGNHP